jgi:putative hydrolase of the HAD superfamily
MIKAVIFDYFGVVATDSYWGDVKKLFNLNGNKKDIDKLALKVNDGDISWYEFCKKIGNFIDISPEEVDKKYHELKLNKELILYIHLLKQNGLKIGLLSNASSEFLHSILNETGMNNIFDSVVVSSDIGVSKPHPQIYSKMLDNLCIYAHESLFIDDMHANIAGAEAIGMQTVQFFDTKQTIKEISRYLADTDDEFTS